MSRITDDDIRAALREVDEDTDEEVGSWAADFIENVVYTYRGPLSPAQREAALKILARHHGDPAWRE